MNRLAIGGESLETDCRLNSQELGASAEKDCTEELSYGPRSRSVIFMDAMSVE